MPEEKSPRRLSILSGILVALVLGTIAYVFLMSRFSAPWRSAMLLERAIGAIAAEFVEPVSVPHLTRAALAGMVASLGDPNTRLLVGRDYRTFKETTQATYAGIGVLLGFREKRHYIMEVFPKSPAAEAGVMEGDAIVEVDGTAVHGLSPDEVSAKVRGPEGTTLVLGVLRPGESDTLRIKIERRKIELDTVYYEMLDEALGYVFIVEFANRTRRDMEEPLLELQRSGMKGLIVDLRRNPGGLLGQAVDVADALLTSGVIVTVRQRGQPDEVYHAKDDGVEPECPIVVLVDGESASASEIVAAAFRDVADATVVGTRSFGKGSVQKILELDGKEPMAIQLTVGKYLTPKGLWIGDGHGMKPDVEVAAGEGFVMRYYRKRELASDPQLAKAIEVLRQKLATGSAGAA